MQRRSSSLVTINLDDKPTDVDVASSRSPAAVIEIWQNDEINKEIDGFRSAEKIFTFVVDIDHHELRVEQEELLPVGICSKIVYCFDNCKNGYLCSRGWDQLSEYIGNIWKTFNEKLHQRCDRSYLETYFIYASSCGVSPFRIGNENQRVVWLKKVPYYIVNTLAIVDTVLLSKMLMVNLIGAQESRSTEIRLYLLNSSVGSNILIRIGFWYSLTFHSQKYVKAIQTIATSAYRRHLYTVKRFFESALVCGSSLSIVLIKTHLGLFDGIEPYIISNAESLLYQFCFTRSCQQVDLSQLNFATISLGFLGWAAQLAGSLFEQIARDGILLSALTLGKSANEFRFRGRLETSNPLDSLAIGTEIENDYNGIKTLSKHVNSAFNIVFRFYLLANIFMFAVFVDQWFDPHTGKIVKGVSLANFVSVCITFYYANQTAKTGDRFREWMKNKTNHTSMGMSQMDVLMENSSSSSIGFGRGALFIYDATLIGFASAVAAYYFGIVETRAPYIKQGNENFHGNSNNSKACCTCFE
ncbi:unnamed protein product [Orchesella dallaii]|uniref:Gustatory receptor n=1 Tax=Orchesella dallaii TaxID=48710 RepID=A0ABP1RVU1_9HEXA